MSEQVLLIEHRTPVRILTLHRPEARNALNSELIQELERAVDEARFAEDLRVLISLALVAGLFVPVPTSRNV
jgi:enoyl-CoA hydratase/carnithine racemase